MELAWTFPLKMDSVNGMCCWKFLAQNVKLASLGLSGISLLRGWVLRELVFRAQRVLTWA